MADNEAVMVIDKNGNLVPREFGQDEGARNYESYEEAVDDINAQTMNIAHQELEMNWAIGRVAYLIKEKSKYGGHGIEEFSKDIDKSPSTIYTDIKLYMTYTLDDIRRMRDEDIPLRRVNQLLKAPDDSRDLIEEAIVDFRMSDDTLKTLIDNANEGVIIPEDEAGKRKYYEKCRDGGFSKKAVEQAEEDEEEEEDDEEEAKDPGEKFAANVRTACDQMSLHISQLEQDITGMRNILTGQLYQGLDEETKASLTGSLSGLQKQLSRVLNLGYRLLPKLPGDTTKEADSNAAKE